MDGLEWQTRRACDEGVDPELFFPHQNDAAEDAKAVCRMCPVAAECLNYALDTRQEFGVWGCMTESERRALLRRRGESFVNPKRANEPTPDARCGTYAGSTAHRRRDEWLCDDCRDAKSAYELARARAARGEIAS